MNWNWAQGIFSLGEFSDFQKMCVRYFLIFRKYPRPRIENNLILSIRKYPYPEKMSMSTTPSAISCSLKELSELSVPAREKKNEKLAAP
jgi:hypothetical protein